MSAAVVALVLALAALHAVEGPAAEAPAPPRPNVVFIISDDHGWPDYGFLGHPVVRTPRIDRLAAESLVFPRGYVTSSLCCPSLASIITGLYPHQHRVTSNDPPAPAGMAPPEFYRSQAFRDGRERMNQHLEAVATLPRLLAAKGYLSFQSGKWWQGDFRRGGFTQGMTSGGRHGDQGLAIGRKTLQPVFDFLDQARREGKPFFLWYAPMLPHTPHDPPERLLERYREKTPSIHQARYWAMVEWFDETCGALLDGLEERGLSTSTVVFYLADNGWFQDPDRAGHRRSKLTPYDGGLRTPILVRRPGRVTPGRSDDLAISIDLVPTVLRLAGIDPPAGLPGIDLLDPEARRKRTAVFGECFTHDAVDLDRPAANLLHRWAVEGAWKLILPRDPLMRPELYDLSADPHEEKDRAADLPERVEALRRRLDAWWTP